MRTQIAASITAVVLSLGSAHATDARRVTIMSVNAENLFDTADNPAREGDNTYLPLAQKQNPAHVALCNRMDERGRQECLTLNWDEDVLRNKIGNLAQIIGRFEGRGPDIIVFQEVENEFVLTLLRDALPQPASYVTVRNLDDSPGRGINVGLISRLPLANGVPPESIRIAFPEDVKQTDGKACNETRNLTTFTLTLPGGAALTVFAVHMPSGGQAHPCRAHVAGVLVAAVNALPADRMAVVVGDTNLNCQAEDQRTIATVLRPVLVVPDEVNQGCRAPGSSFFAGTWSFLDLIMTNRLLLPGDRGGASWFADFGSFRTAITAPDIQVQTNANNQVSPRRFNPRTGTGATDHWPVVMDLIRRQ